jgi:beta-glucanase (GH16 family)
VLRLLPIVPLLFATRAVQDAPPDVVKPSAPVPAGYELVWRDEFDGKELDPTKWGHRLLGPRRDAINVESAVALDGKGNLLIATTREPGTDGSSAYHTGMIATEGRFEATYGFFEVRMKVQSQVGHWSAFWLQSPTIGRPLGDPAQAGVEIDVVEYLCDPKHRNRPQHALHWDGYGEERQTRHHKHEVPDMHAGYHTFGLEWTPDEYVFFTDGVETWRVREAISQRSQYLILSVEVGDWAGDIAEAKLPDAVAFDYVRVFQRPPDER